MIARWKSLSVVAAVLALAGCQSAGPLIVECKSPVDAARKGPALIGMDYGMQMTPIPLNAVQFTDETWKLVAVQSLKATRTATDTVQVVTRLVNCSDQPVAIRARTSFLAQNEAPTEPISAWRVVYLPPRATAVYSENSVSQSVASFLIEVAKN